ncbi:MAG: V-type ATPase subunit [Candidatus Diapherotrites archaeon]
MISELLGIGSTELFALFLVFLAVFAVLVTALLAIGFFTAQALPFGLYAYAISRMRVMKGKMIGEKKLKALIESYDSEEIISAFEGTVYEQFIPITKSIEEIENALSKALAATYSKVVEISPQQAKEFFKLMNARYDVLNIKKILESKQGKETDLDLYPSTFSEAFLQRLIDAGTADEAIDLLKESPHYKFAQLVESASSKNYDYLLDKYLYDSLLSRNRIASLAQKVGMLNDLDILTELFGVQADLINIKLVLRAKMGSNSTDLLLDRMLSNGFELNEPKRKSLAEADSVNEVVSLLEGTIYFNALNEKLSDALKEKRASLMEPALDALYLKKIRSAFSRQAFGLSPIVSFLLLKEKEIQTLRTILNGIEEGLPKQMISEMVVY